MVDLEICLASDGSGDLAAQAINIAKGGARRIELCSNMENDGLTPSLNAIQCVREATAGTVELLVMLRPVSGDFSYTEKQVNEMLEMIPALAQAGADGIVTGGLTSENAINVDAMKQLAQQTQSHNLAMTFHRAFDAISDHQAALRSISELSISRVLSAGTSWLSGLGAEQGIEKLEKFLQYSQGQIELVVGGGVKHSNIQWLKHKLHRDNRRLSFHTHSAVLTDGLVDVEKVTSLVALLAD
ncbi:copper homeostasis protein CutC [Neptunicella marina]|uniref:Copper homeostasis protein cutC homolog n=1 Tax=Neptunicella marina TaxID=2125989 RepID=A0A8J6ITH8_9ALTE|nr:copper homeostasis protein CutC [Neptunicella marina]MBC3765632.1 copper homeostasis protein CutC [Neptunicella marina]